MQPRLQAQRNHKVINPILTSQDPRLADLDLLKMQHFSHNRGLFCVKDHASNFCMNECLFIAPINLQNQPGSHLFIETWFAL